MTQSGAGLKNAVAVYEKLKGEWNKNAGCDLKLCGNYLDELKIALIGLSFLPSTKVAPSKQELILAREVLELGAQWAVRVKDIAGFKRYISQVKTYYFDFKDQLPESAYMYQLLGLNLLSLLSENCIAEFHTELELLDPKEIHSNIYIKHPVAIEQYLMEGSYNKIILSRGNVPAESYSFFMDSLVDTIREEIASCFESAYEKLLLESAKNMLFFKSAGEFEKFCQKRNWKIVSGNIVFELVEKEVKSVNADELITHSLSYANELERIV
eukprot:Nk52_evm1s384 gene=Nk52_evmTU1s384